MASLASLFLTTEFVTTRAEVHYVESGWPLPFIRQYQERYDYPIPKKHRFAAEVFTEVLWVRWGIDLLFYAITLYAAGWFLGHWTKPVGPPGSGRYTANR